MRNTSECTVPVAPTAGHFYSPGALDSLEGAAVRLGEDQERLRERCELAAEQCGDVAVAQLDGGVVAFKTEGSWRFRLPLRRGEP
jgi:hypothetical protein